MRRSKISNLSSKSSQIDRRTFLRGLGGAAIALPLLEAMGCDSAKRGFGGANAGAGAAANTGASDGVAQHSSALTTGPKRLIVFWTDNGTVMNSWRPASIDLTKSGVTSLDGVQLGPMLSTPAAGTNYSINDFKKYLTFVDGLGMLMGGNIGNGHDRSRAISLTGSTDGGAVSFDNRVADFIKQSVNLKLPSLHLGVGGMAGEVSRGSSGAVSRYQLPSDAWDAVFKGFTAPAQQNMAAQPSAAEVKANLRRKSILDGSLGDCTALKGRLGSVDQKRLDAHCQGIRDLELQIKSTTVASAVGCGVPMRPGTDSTDPSVRKQTQAKLQIDMMVMALACDLTRVSTLAFGGDDFEWLGVALGGAADYHHSWVHNETPYAWDKRDQTVTAVNTWHAQNFAYLLHSLAAMPEGSGTMLDNTVILYANEFSDGHDHWCDQPMPYLVAGLGGGYFKGNRWVTNACGVNPPNQYTTRDHMLPAPWTPALAQSDLFVSIMNAMGMSDKTFGDPMFSKGPLANLT